MPAMIDHAMPRTSSVDELRCVLDLVHLSRQTLGDRGLEVELLTLFDRQAANALARLAGPAGVDGKNAADIAHMLKGSARAVGAFAVSSAAAEFETASRAGSMRPDILEKLSDAVTEARNTIAVLLR